MERYPIKVDAIRAIMGQGKVSQLSDNEYNYKGNTPPSDEAIQTKWDELKTEFSALQYQRDRQYPELGEQLDLLFHDMTAGKGTKSGEWYKAIKKVKADNPKG